MDEFVLDDVIQEMSLEQMQKLAEFQLKVSHVQNLPNFHNDTLQDPNNQYICSKVLGKDGQPAYKIDCRFLISKEFARSIGNLTPQELRDGMWKNVKHDDPDTLSVRHLRARNWNVDVALCMMINSVRWRNDENVFDGILGGGDEKINQNSQSGSGEQQKIDSEVMAQLRSGKSFCNGTDKKGRVLLCIRVAKHNPKMQGLKGYEKYSIFQSESARMLLRPPITTTAIVFDLGGFSMANMDWNAVRILTSGLEDKYPESMGATYVYRAPWIVNSIWNVVKHWMPGTEAQKVRFIKNPRELSQFVDLKHLPADMGGTGEFEFNFIEPQHGENGVMADTTKKEAILNEREGIYQEYEKEALIWAQHLLLERAKQSPNSTLTEAQLEDVRQKTAVKDSEGAQRAKREVVLKLRENYWQADRYVRGRAQQDRAGMIGEGGAVRLSTVEVKA